mgnify:CR=1 FL=1
MKLKTILFAIAAVIIIGISWWLISPIFIVREAYEPSLNSSSPISQGSFQPKAHDVQGKALLIEQDGKKIIRFEDFETINGPDLRIYLATDLDAKDFVDLGEIKATKGNVNYEIDSAIDTTKYNKVLVWCRAFGVLFSFVVLN